MVFYCVKCRAKMPGQRVTVSTHSHRREKMAKCMRPEDELYARAIVAGKLTGHKLCLSHCPGLFTPEEVMRRDRRSRKQGGEEADPEVLNGIHINEMAILAAAMEKAEKELVSNTELSNLDSPSTSMADANETGSHCLNEATSDSDDELPELPMEEKNSTREFQCAVCWSMVSGPRLRLNNNHARREKIAEYLTPKNELLSQAIFCGSLNGKSICVSHAPKVYYAEEVDRRTLQMRKAMRKAKKVVSENPETIRKKEMEILAKVINNVKEEISAERQKQRKENSGVELPSLSLEYLDAPATHTNAHESGKTTSVNSGAGDGSLVLLRETRALRKRKKITYFTR